MLSNLGHLTVIDDLDVLAYPTKVALGRVHLPACPEDFVVCCFLLFEADARRLNLGHYVGVDTASIAGALGHNIGGRMSLEECIMLGDRDRLAVSDLDDTLISKIEYHMLLTAAQERYILSANERLGRFPQLVDSGLINLEVA